jgi:hypothetical protein
MHYKLRLEKVDYDQNMIQCTEVWVTEEMLRNSPNIDVLKMCADQLIDKYRSDMRKLQTSQMDVSQRVVKSDYLMNKEELELRNKILADTWNRIRKEKIEISPDLADDL